MCKDRHGAKGEKENLGHDNTSLVHHEDRRENCTLGCPGDPGVLCNPDEVFSDRWLKDYQRSSGVIIALA